METTFFNRKKLNWTSSFNFPDSESNFVENQRLVAPYFTYELSNISISNSEPVLMLDEDYSMSIAQIYNVKFEKNQIKVLNSIH